jgi:hypothetical protein
MSEKKHLHTLSELSAHPIARNIEWKDILPALSSVGLLHSESNGNYDFTRNGHKIVIERSHKKVLEISEVLSLRHFLVESAEPEAIDSELKHALIVAVDHHNATIIQNPGFNNVVVERVHADLTKGRILHKHPQTAPFSDHSPSDSDGYFDSIITYMMHSNRIVILSHGTGSSSAAEKLLIVITKKYPKILSHIVAMKKCDLENMSEPQILELGTTLLHAPSTDLLLP